jgi:hypothetical protein
MTVEKEKAPTQEQLTKDDVRLIFYQEFLGVIKPLAEAAGERELLNVVKKMDDFVSAIINIRFK